MPRNIIRSGGNGKLIGYVRPPFKYIPSDSDAQTYILAVEAVDGQVLENNVRMAIDNFVKGCKNDSIWNSIKSCCILSGARTLDGALIPLKGTAPTNNNFISTDYDRKTGLKGNGSNKYLNTNRSANADPRNDKHVSIYLSEIYSSGTFPNYFGDNSTYMKISKFDSPIYSEINANVNGGSGGIQERNSNTVGFKAIQRIDSSSITSYLVSSSNTSSNFGSVIQSTNPLYMFANNQNGSALYFSGGRIAFYSIGIASNDVGLPFALTLLRDRVNTLISVFNTL